MEVPNPKLVEVNFLVTNNDTDFDIFKYGHTSLDSLLESTSGMSLCGSSIWSPSEMLPAARDVTDVREDPVIPESWEILGRGGTGGLDAPLLRPDVGR